MLQFITLSKHGKKFTVTCISPVIASAIMSLSDFNSKEVK
jgi:hypothetical protein